MSEGRLGRWLPCALRVPCTGSGNGADSYTSRDPRTIKHLDSLTWFPKWTRLFLDANTSPSAHAIVTLPDDEAGSEHGHLLAHATLRARPALTPSTGAGDGHQHGKGSRAFRWMEIKRGNHSRVPSNTNSSNGPPRRGADLPTFTVTQEDSASAPSGQGADLRLFSGSSASASP